MSKRYPKRDQYWDELYSRHEGQETRFFVDNVNKRWYVETRPDEDGRCKGGTVSQVIRDEYGLAVQLKCYRKKETESGRIIKKWNTVDVNDVVFYEGWDMYFSTEDASYVSPEEMDEMAAELGYRWDDERECYYNPETGDEMCW